MPAESAGFGIIIFARFWRLIRVMETVTMVNVTEHELVDSEEEEEEENDEEQEKGVELDE